MTTNDEKMEIAKTIIQQMGGDTKLRVMIGAKDILALDSGVQFSFKGSKISNKVVIELTQDDLYAMVFYKINMQNIDKSMIPVKIFEGVYNDMLIPIFEETTGLYLYL